jgi:hypothetical protein
MMPSEIHPQRAARYAGRQVYRSAAAALLLLTCAAPAAADISRVGATTPLFVTSLLRGNDVAYDPANDVYLVVGGYGPVYGYFVNAAGTPVGSLLTIKAGSAPFAHYPRVEYSPDVSNGAGGQGGFLVSWHQDDAPGVNSVHVKVVAYPNVLVTGDVAVSGTDATFWEAAPAIAYSRTSQKFLVVWQTYGTGAYAIHGRFVGANGAPQGTVIPITNPGGARDPGVAWDSAKDEFGISYGAWDSQSAYAGFVRLRSDGFLSGRMRFGNASGVYVSDVEYNTASATYVVVWTQFAGTYRAHIDGNSQMLSSGLVSATVGAYDSVGLAYNPTSGTFLAVGHQAGPEVGAVEMGGDGSPIGPAVTVTAGARTGSFYPRAGAHANRKDWGVSLAQNLNTLASQIVTTSGTGGSGQPLSLTISVDKAMPIPEGTSLTWTGHASGGTAPIQYQFWRFSSTTGMWTMAQDWSADNTYSWSPPAGTAAIQVWGRSSGSSAAYDAFAGTGIFTVTGPAPKLTALTANVSFPAPFNVPITFTATATGGIAPLEYQFWRYSPAAGWVLGQDYSTTNTFTWFPPQGTNAVQVWVRNPGSAAAWQDWRSTGLFGVGGSSTPARLTNLTANVNFPASPSSLITWTATATGATQVEYKFFLLDAATGSWSILRDWGTSNQASWMPGVGNAGWHAVQVWVRNVGSGAAYEDWRGTSNFNITDISALTLTSSVPLTGLSNGQRVTFTAHLTSAGSGPWEFAFFTFNGTSWTTYQAYTANASSVVWTASSGTRALQVWVRSAGSHATWEAWTSTNLFIVP